MGSLWVCYRCRVMLDDEGYCACTRHFKSKPTSAREKPMKQDATKKIAAQYLVGEATLEELDDAVVDERIRRRDAEIEKLSDKVDANYIDVLERIVGLESRINNRPWWKKMLGMK